MEEWKEYKLGDCVEAVIDNRGKSAPTKPLGEFPLLEINSIGGYYPNYSVIRKYVDKVTYNTWFRSGHPICGDILIPTVGTIGIISIMDNHKACIAQNLIALRTKKEISNIFIYYFLKSPIVKKQLINLDIGGVQPSIKVPHLLNLSISLPEKDIQHKIASILSSLDDKIEVNRKINENLEQQAQALFKSWFVDFEPFKNGEFVESELGMIPKGWRVGCLDELCSFISRGLTPKYDETSDELILGQTCVRNNIVTLNNARKHRPKTKNEKWVQQWDVLLNSTGVGSLGRVGIVYFNMDNVAIDSHITVVRTSNPIYRHYVGRNLLSRQLEIENMAVGSTGQTELPRDRVKVMTIIIPSQDSMIRFNNIIEPMAISMYNNIIESRRLAELRDTLLPKLMSGELKVNDIH